MRLGYAYLSPDDPDTAEQLATLEDAGCDQVVREKATDNARERPQLELLLTDLQVDDVVVVWALNRLSRSLKDLLWVLERIDQAGAHFQSLTDAIDTTAPTGRMMMRMTSALAGFERSLHKELTRTGLAEARKDGRVGGRRPKLTHAQQQQIVDLVESGQKSAAAAAREFHVHPATISRLLARQKPPPEPTVTVETISRKRPTRKKTKARKKGSVSQVAATSLDALGLARPEGFKDGPTAVRLLEEITRPRRMMNKTEWHWDRTSAPQFLSVVSAEDVIATFRQRHSKARIEQSYLFKDKSLIRLTAFYEEGEPDHRLAYSAYDR